MLRTITLLTAATMAFAAPANATIVTERVSVSYADLNLDRAEDRATLRARVDAAVRSACKRDGTRYTRSTLDRDCLAKARQAAFTKLASVQPAATVAAGN
ncbi:UrcA family protein [Parerythrobacter jejuensis]|uniref:UrcA family protein n=1 Tax=Parerythrobacter jejuensis TaxID=795812 RepID=A0A845ALQ9_9SPHN|nr:UrcA family protein [Parerythrobacter jejuensis]MXP31200.1 UrcA family protein [Parerythrobacter jejuensis]MXP33960.1 UrcA family protein [Parerythrobacter jejuensis]